MNQKVKKVSTVILALFIFSTLILTPSAWGLQTTATPRQETVRSQIEDGFSSYLNTRNLHVSTAESAKNWFSDFLMKNPQYQVYLSDYANLTKPDISKLLPDTSIISTGVIDTQIKIVNETINGTTYQLCYSTGHYANGQTFISENVSCGGIDPTFCIEIYPQTISILGFQIQFGEDDALGVYVNSTEVENYMTYFDSTLDTVSSVSEIVGVAIDGACALAGALAPPVIPFAAAVGAVCSIVAGDISAEAGYFKDIADDNAYWGHGLQYCFENYVFYPSFLSIINVCDRVNIWVRHYISETEDTWLCVYPHYIPWDNLMSGLGSEAIGWAISNLFHEIAQYYPVNTWHPFDSVFPFTPLPAGGSTGLLYPSVSCIDDQYNGVSANIYIDGSNYGNNPSLTLTPEAHYIRVDYYIPDSGGYGYTFSYMVVDGNNYYDTQNDIELSSNSTIEVHYIYEAEPSNLLDVQAISWGDWGSLQADVSIDNYISDTTEFETLLGPGTHIISIPMLAWDETFGWVCFNGVISTDLDCAIMLSGDPYVIEFTIPNDQNPHTLTFYYFAG